MELLVELWKRIDKKTAHSASPDIEIGFIRDLIVDMIAEEFYSHYSDLSETEKWILSLLELGPASLKSIKFEWENKTVKYENNLDKYDQSLMDADKTIDDAIKRLEGSEMYYIELFNDKYRLSEIPFG